MGNNFSIQNWLAYSQLFGRESSSNMLMFLYSIL